MSSATLGAASMKSCPASTKAALRPTRTDSWSSTTAMRAGRASATDSERSITVLILTPDAARIRRRSWYLLSRARGARPGRARRPRRSVAHEGGDRLDVVGAREEVEGTQPRAAGAELGEHPRVAREG